MTDQFHFGVPFQRALIRLCMVDEGFNHKAMSFVQPSYFTTKPLGWTFGALQDYYQTYGMRCTEIPLREMVKKVRPENLHAYSNEVERIIQLSHPVEDAFIKSELTDFIQRNLFAAAHKDSSRFYNEGKIIEAYDAMQYAMDRIRQTNFETESRSLFFEEFEKRQKRRLELSMEIDATITTSVTELDDVLEGGISIGEMLIIIAYAKIGKSTWLVNQGFAALRAARVPVLHIGLEGRLSQTENKYDTLFTGELYTEVKMGDIDPSSYRALLSEYKMMKNMLRIRHITDWDTNVLHIDEELKHNAAEGHRPSLIIVDYLDLLRARTKVDSETQHQLNAARDLKQLANKGYAIWTGSQATRPNKMADEKEHIVKSSMIADAYAKIRIADGYGSLNQTREEKKLDLHRLYWEDYRDAPGAVYLRLHNDRSRMRMGLRAEYVTADDDDD